MPVGTRYYSWFCSGVTVYFEIAAVSESSSLLIGGALFSCPPSVAALRGIVRGEKGMNDIIARVVGVLLLSAGCSDENRLRPNPDATPLEYDAASPNCSFEPELSLSSCNPATQAGCDCDEKCAELILVADDPMTELNEFLAQIACVPVGVGTAGMECTSGTPGQAFGHDTCIAGYDCFQGVCEEICGSTPDTCLTDPPAAFGEGANCANNFENHFNDTTGVCLAACDPTSGIVETPEGMEPVVVNTVCGAGSSCGMNAVTAQTTCSRTPEQSATQTQNEVPFGPVVGQYYSNGCASGFTTLLNENVGADGGEPNCARYCTPTNSYLDADGTTVIGTPDGMNNNCSLSNLQAAGGVAGVSAAHQCRYIQALYSNTKLVPESVGMCMPIQSRGGEFGLNLMGGATLKAEPPLNTYGDCSIFAWGEIKAAWNAAAPNGAEAANAAFDEVCISLPLEQRNPAAVFYQKCVGFYYGCLSLEEQDSIDTPVGATAGSGGQILRDRFDMYQEASQSQLVEP